MGKPVIGSLIVALNMRAFSPAWMDSDIAMEQSEEYLDGKLKAKYGDCFIRGNNVLCISAASPKA